MRFSAVPATYIAALESLSRLRARTRAPPCLALLTPTDEHIYFRHRSNLEPEAPASGNSISNPLLVIY